MRHKTLHPTVVAEREPAQEVVAVAGCRPHRQNTAASRHQTRTGALARHIDDSTRSRSDHLGPGGQKPTARYRQVKGPLRPDSQTCGCCPGADYRVPTFLGA